MENGYQVTRKICKDCKEEKDIEEFFKNSHCRGGREVRCKDCKRGRDGIRKINDTRIAKLFTREFLDYHYNKLEKTLLQIAEENNTTYNTVLYYMNKRDLKRRHIVKTSSLEGQVFEKLRVIKPIFKNDKESNGVFKWLCYCDPELGGCGKYKKCSTGNLKNKKVKSCGCWIDIKTGPENPVWKGGKHIPGTFLSKYRNHAKRRCIIFDLSLEYLDDLLEKQNFKCAITGLPLSFENYGYKDLNCNASLDRIDSNGNYEEGNVQWVLREINMMKQSLSMEYFIRLCKLVVEYNNAK
jgi:hypothetical protein